MKATSFSSSSISSDDFPQIRFDNKVAIITGAGNGLGKAYALEMAKRGAKVVVNDLGCDQFGNDSNPAVADQVVAEIKQNGGDAMADYNSIENAPEIIAHALNHYGQIDILINNAAVLRDASFANLTLDDWDICYRMNLLGTFRMCKAVWNHMKAQGSGKILNSISAAGLYGNFGQSAYASMKMGIEGLSKVLSKEGMKTSTNIQVNTVSPIAFTRLTSRIFPLEYEEFLTPECSVPFCLYLVHSSCVETGQTFELGGGWIGKLRYERTKGLRFRPQDLTPEAVALKWKHLQDFTNASHPTSTQEAFEPIFEQITHPTTSSASDSRTYSSDWFAQVNQYFQSHPENLKQLKASMNSLVYFQIDQFENWVLNFQANDPTSELPIRRLKQVPRDLENALFLATSQECFIELVTGRLEFERAINRNKLRFRGKYRLVLKLKHLTKVFRKILQLPPSKL